ncbi:hypothetical protein P8A22_18660 [Streptomyces laculatispora]|uniref:Uncharacterized protein n=1 Tax=Streptomyces laculatispora TaxID=887464 RepID=A0ABY9I856_9ACTN|nr:hypothetical protein [Streptomyces laculatispora]WLQ41821.1 hypothetical protein P8A22_18660 [Streptomyces laculatispora]
MPETMSETRTTAIIAARALQGIGGGGLMSVTMVVLRELGGSQYESGNGSDGQGAGSTKSEDDSGTACASAALACWPPSRRTPACGRCVPRC